MQCLAKKLIFLPLYEVNLSFEVLNIDFGQGAAKISELKVGVRKKISAYAAAPAHTGSNRAGRQIFFFDLQL